MSVGGTDDGDGDALLEATDEDPSARPTEPDGRTDYPAFVRWLIAEVLSEPDSQATIDEVVEIALQADHAMWLQQATELDWDEAPRHLVDVRCPTLIIHGATDRTLEASALWRGVR